MVTSRTGSANWPSRIMMPLGADGEVAADRVHARVEAAHGIDEQAEVDPGHQISSWVPHPGATDSAWHPTPGVER